ncbi:hypothetical protein MKX08_001733 [Trichoderma sp. CBMAI-0020]|nr:hypothetical protein MKX08_001733 [Trichoderma sp. CBMAI-0020]
MRSASRFGQLRRASAQPLRRLDVANPMRATCSGALEIDETVSDAVGGDEQGAAMKDLDEAAVLEEIAKAMESASLKMPSHKPPSFQKEEH